MDHHFPHDSINTVSVDHRDGKWVVEVREDGKIAAYEFLHEQHALSFADGQRFRLGVFRN